MKRTLSNPVFLICVGLAIVNQLIEKGFGIFIPIIHSYLDDVLCFPIVLTLGLGVYRFRWPNYQLSVYHIWPVVLIYSVYFEWYLPLESTVYTADLLDVFMYVMGALIFQRFIKHSSTNLNATSFQNS